LDSERKKEVIMKEVIMRSTRRESMGYAVCVRDIPET